MGEKTGIAWTDSTWNPVRGCTKVSAGCRNCYAETFAERWRGVPGHAFERGFDVRLVPNAMELPIHWKKPRRVFVNSMSDLFHEEVPDSFIVQVIATMAVCQRHTFQVLTKRPQRMRRLMCEVADGRWDEDLLKHLIRFDAVGEVIRWTTKSPADLRQTAMPWPLPNVWLGVSVEDQRAADERIPELLATPAALRFLSCEPLLGPVDLRRYLGRPLPKPYAVLVGADAPPPRGVDWVIIGGESGPGARPCDIAWVRDLVGQCKSAGVPAFVKQLGAVAIGGNLFARRDRAGRDPDEWPADLRVQQFPEAR